MTDQERETWRLHFRQEGRKARLVGTPIAEMPGEYAPVIPGSLWRDSGVEPGVEWIAGWREQDAWLSTAQAL